MSSVFLQVGQCGNQIGRNLLENALNRKDRSTHHVFKHLDGKFRSVNVDTEPKVVKRLVYDVKHSNFREGNAILGKRGRGSNWAFGYHGHREDVLLEDCLEAIRKEVERCDNFSGVVMLHSICGGTGSGLGSHLCETLRDLYPLAYILSCVVVPHVSGESSLQHYNSLLCLSWLQKFSDGIVWLANDDVMNAILQTTKTTPGGTPNVSLTAMNRHIADCLAGLLLPVDSLTPKSGMSLGMEPWDLIKSVCPMPACKFIHASHISRSKCSWDDIAKNAINKLQKRDVNGRLYSSLSNVVVARGDKTMSFSSRIKSVDEKIKKAYNTVAWNPYPVDYWIGKESLAGNEVASLTIAANYSSIVDVIDSVLDRSRRMYDAGAFVHSYWKHGGTTDEFTEAFDVVGSVKEDYKEMTS